MKSERVYDNLVIWYFSGTGNARNCAGWIAGEAGKMGVRTRVINIDRFREVMVPEMPEGETLFGFCFPTHGFNLAPSMLKYIRKFPRGKKAKVFLLNTRAGMKLSKIFLPGISGLALFLPAFIFLLKGYRIVALRPVDLPSNWISLHPGLKESVNRSIYEHWKGRVQKFSVTLIKGKKVWRGLYDIIQDLLVTPIAAGYFFLGRFMLAKTFIATQDCTACDVCVKRCPTNSIVMKNGLPYWKFTCESCMRCMNACPHRAIETMHSISIGLWYLAWSLIPVVFLQWLSRAGMIDFTGRHWLYELIFYAALVVSSFALVWFAYRILHFGMRYRWVHRIVKRTSFTSYKFWRRYKTGLRYR